ncbi:MAG: tRNA (N(6)-L-threonylcarbamoyladenosine(37)-C(2))-methylthiotransferase MtaB [Magnetococcales bacterium]|nr:tRNA (N(6)-L-threonylcarbamoyladenosine(37)-C(2))-methylthiotransferase MtaB [Magnetococcales bacterium]
MNEDVAAPSVTVLTMGCRVNQFETDRLLEMGRMHGYRTTHRLDEADLIIVNTCSVTGESERQARKLVRKLIRDHPSARLIVTGCYAHRAPETFLQHANVALVLGNSEKKQLWQRWGRYQESIRRNDPAILSSADILEENDPGGWFDVSGHPSSDRARSLLRIQDGCDRRCTYCLIPQVRGPGVSTAPEVVLEQARALLAAGSRELVLLGIDIGAYGRDRFPRSSLAGMVHALLPLCKEARIRLSSVDPMDLEDRLLELFFPGSPLCPHLHLSIQSGDDSIRKRMGRQGSRRDILDRIERLRRINPRVVLGADLIAGFPTESPEAFANTLSLVEAADLTRLHVFPYSQRPGTPAARFPSRFQIPDAVIRKRAALLREAAMLRFSQAIPGRLGTCAEVLVERLADGVAWGTSEDYRTVRFLNRHNDPHGAIRRLLLVEHDPVENVFVGIVPELSTGLSTDSVDNS